MALVIPSPLKQCRGECRGLLSKGFWMLLALASRMLVVETAQVQAAAGLIVAIWLVWILLAKGLLEMVVMGMLEARLPWRWCRAARLGRLSRLQEAAAFLSVRSLLARPIPPLRLLARPLALGAGFVVVLR